MIFVERSRADERGIIIEPNREWFDLATQSRDQIAGEVSERRIDKSVYGHVQVRAALEKLFFDKCAYCELPATAGFSWDVEHFRPKGRVAERRDHPGYWWLAYEWTNLYLSCNFSNRRRRTGPDGTT